jgi:VanZ family protein
MRDPQIALLSLVALLMVHATLFPYSFSNVSSGYLLWSPTDSRGQWLDVFLNFYFFLPLGLLAGIRFRDRQGMLASLIGAILLSLSVELAQAHIPGRYSSLRDVALNSLGAASGIVLAHLTVFDRELIDRRIRQAIEDRGILFLGMLWACWRFFPFLPRLRLNLLAYALETGLDATWLSMQILEGAVVNGFLVFLVGGSYGRKVGLLFSALMLLTNPMELFVAPRVEGLAMVVWGMGGALVAAGFLAADKLPASRTLGALSLGLLLYRELQPFAWEPLRAKQFSWVPFQATFDTMRDAAMRILAFKCFLYWHTLRQICHAWALKPTPVAFAMAGLLLITEWAQQYQPARTPEITDSFLCLIGALPALKLIRAYSGQPDNQSGSPSARQAPAPPNASSFPPRVPIEHE